MKLVHARDGEEALEVLARDPAMDLMLLDINMPRMNGFELLAQLGAKGYLPRLPVIVVTTEGQGGGRRARARAGRRRLPDQAVPRRRSAGGDRRAAGAGT